jgi:hypothetical protein
VLGAIIKKDSIMGYSGLGMQKWIYRQKPRKFLSKDRKPTHDSIASEEIKTDINLAGRTTKNEKKLDYEIETRLNKIRQENRNQKIKSFITLIVISSIIGIVIYAYVQNDGWKKTVPLRSKNMELNMGKAYEIAIDAGDDYRDFNEFEAALRQYRLANRIFPDKYIPYLRIYSIYKIECLNYNKHCMRAISILDSMVVKFPDKNYAFREKKDLEYILNRKE